MKKSACHYALLRFRPFVETGEFANVGIVLIAPEAGFFGYRLLTHYSRITRFFHQLDRQVYLRGRGLFKQEIDRFAAELGRLALGDGHTTPTPALGSQLFAEFVRPREAMLQFDDQRIALAEDPQAKLDALFDHYIERNFVTKDRALGWLLIDNAIHGRPLTRAQLEVLALYALTVGALLARKRAELALRNSEARYQSVVQTQSELICRYLPDLTLTFVNNAYCRYFDTTPEQLIGHSFLELIPEAEWARDPSLSCRTGAHQGHQYL